MMNVLKFLTLFSLSSQIKHLLSGLEFSKCMNSKQGRGVPDQTVSSKGVLSGSALFIQAFLAGSQ